VSSRICESRWRTRCWRVDIWFDERSKRLGDSCVQRDESDRSMTRRMRAKENGKKPKWWKSFKYKIHLDYETAEEVVLGEVERKEQSLPA
jgi:hypothetical protein